MVKRTLDVFQKFNWGFVILKYFIWSKKWNSYSSFNFILFSDDTHLNSHPNVLYFIIQETTMKDMQGTSARRKTIGKDLFDPFRFNFFFLHFIYYNTPSFNFFSSKNVIPFLFSFHQAAPRVLLLAADLFTLQIRLNIIMFENFISGFSFFGFY